MLLPLKKTVTQQPKNKQMIAVGRLAAPYGIKGWLHLLSFTHPPDNIFQYTNWQTNHRDQWQSIQVAAHKPHGNGFIVKVQGCDDCNQAVLLKGAEILIDRAQLPDTVEGEYYWNDLIGLTVIHIDGHTLGIIDYLFATDANDVIVTKGQKIHYIPYTKDAIKSVNLAAGTITVDWDI